MLREGENILELSAHVYGNYHKYYTFHSANSRIQLLTGRSVFQSIWTAQGRPANFRILDIGCNEGELSMELLRLVQAELPSEVVCELVGADIDPSLIELAKEKYKDSSATANFHCVDFLDHSAVDIFTAVIRDKFGSQEAFHLVTIFSTTMWVHINHGADGLAQFFRHACSLLVPRTGSMIIEPQPSKCYKSAVKRCRKLGLPEPKFIRSIDVKAVEDTVKDTLQSVKRFDKVIQLGREDWERALIVFSDFDLEKSILPALI
eukprot:gene26887-32494_t